MKRKLIVILAILLMGTGGAIYLFRYPILRAAGDYLMIQTEVQKADLIVALGGDREREEEGAKLLQDGWGSNIMFTDSGLKLRDYACLGVPPEKAVSPLFAVYTTYEEALVTLRVMREKGFNSAIIVTSSYHLRRTSFIFRKVFGGTNMTLAFYPARNEAFQMSSWWKSYIGRKYVIMEYLGLIYYSVRYRL